MPFLFSKIKGEKRLRNYGSAIAEVALATPIVLVLALGGIEIANYLQVRAEVNHTVLAAARRLAASLGKAATGMTCSQLAPASNTENGVSLSYAVTHNNDFWNNGYPILEITGTRNFDGAISKLIGVTGITTRCRTLIEAPTSGC